MNAGTSLCEALELSRNDKLRVKFSPAINATDAHAIDIKYPKIAGLKMFQMYSAASDIKEWKCKWKCSSWVRTGHHI